MHEAAAFKTAARTHAAVSPSTATTGSHLPPSQPHVDE